MLNLKTDVEGGQVSTVDTFDNGLETCVFGSKGSEVCAEYSNEQSAREGHEAFVEQIRAAGGADAWLAAREDERLVQWATISPESVGEDFALALVEEVMARDGSTEREAAEAAIREGVQWDLGPIPAQVSEAVRRAADAKLVWLVTNGQA